MLDHASSLGFHAQDLPVHIGRNCCWHDSERGWQTRPPISPSEFYQTLMLRTPLRPFIQRHGTRASWAL
eukprot:s1796_g11.t1